MHSPVAIETVPVGFYFLVIMEHGGVVLSLTPDILFATIWITLPPHFTGMLEMPMEDVLYGYLKANDLKNTPCTACSKGIGLENKGFFKP